MTTSESIFKWMEENKDFFKAQAICKKVGIDKGNFSKYKKSKSIPQKYIIQIFDIIVPLGYQVESEIKIQDTTKHTNVVKPFEQPKTNYVINTIEEKMPEGLHWKEQLEWKRNHKK